MERQSSPTAGSWLDAGATVPAAGRWSRQVNQKVLPTPVSLLTPI